jgi:hypothetical protein
MLSNVAFHVGPVVGLQKSFFSFRNAEMTCQEMTMRFVENVGNQMLRHHQDRPMLMISIKTAPNNSV